jgi:uncharacterized coiled-coil DUF342 family protein
MSLIKESALLEAQLKEAKAELAMWRALADEHRNTVFKLQQKVECWKGIADNHCNALLNKSALVQELRKEIQDLHEEIDGYEHGSI